MNRRSFLASAGSVLAAAVAGCSVSPGPPVTEQSPTASATPTAAPTATATRSSSPGTQQPTATAGSEVVDVSAGPEGRLRFRPETVEVSVGDTVRWTFDSPGHNVTTLPGSSERVSVPEDAEPFASYEGDQHFAINEVGTTYEHTFTVPGEYVYVCAPHADQGMVGTVLVTE
jgi:plastocyanin